MNGVAPRRLSDAERELVIQTFNATALDCPRDKCIHEVFEAQVRRAPDAIAVEWDGEELTCLAVDRRANQLARHLRRIGVGAEVPVGVCLERSAQMVIAWIAILKAGGAYVRLDPDYPADRVGFMMAEWGASVLALDAGALDNQVGPDSLAYIVYTSRRYTSTLKPSASSSLTAASVSCVAYATWSYPVNNSRSVMACALHRAGSGASGALRWISIRSLPLPMFLRLSSMSPTSPVVRRCVPPHGDAVNPAISQ